MVHTSFGGDWTLEKLEILRRYLDAYTTALKSRSFQLIYVDAFAGEGSWHSLSEYNSDDYDDFRELHKGSSTIALEIQDKPFDRLIFIEKSPDRSKSLEELSGQFPDRAVEVRNGDANEELSLFCGNLGNYDRAVVFLDPFATQVSWQTVETLAQTQKIDCWMLFPLSAVARMMPTDREPSPALATQLDRVFGGRSHWEDFYRPSPQLSLFGDEPGRERQGGSNLIAERYRLRLETVFERVAPSSRTLRNSKNSPMFELFFAASNPVGAPVAIRIAGYILQNL